MLLTRMTVVLSLLAVFAAPAHGQQSSRPSFVIGGVAAGMLAQQESDNLLGLGLSAGVERELSPALTVRTLATVLRSGVGMGDDVGICIPAPDDGCLPTEAMPEWHSTLEVTASVALFPAIPVRLHTGIGIALAWQARKTASSHLMRVPNGHE